MTATALWSHKAHAQTATDTSVPAVARPTDVTADTDKLIDDDVAETQESLKLVQGNIFKPKAGQSMSYWDGLVGHLTVEAGIAGNPWTRSGRNFGQFYVDRANTVTLNQIMGSLSHPVTDIGDGYGFGFNFEVMYGSDARFDPTIGMGSGSLHGLYQWAPTQAHLDFHMPWLLKRGIDVQIGQMYGLLGSEGTPALARPFYTFNYASDYIVPFEVVGIYTTLHLNKYVDWVMGIDAGNSTTFGQAGNNSRPKGTFGFSFNNLLDGNLSFHLMGHFGPQGNNGPTRYYNGWASAGVGKIANERMQYNGDILVTYKLNKKMSVTVDGTYLHDDLYRADAYGVTAYYSYDITPDLTFNARGEILRDNTGLFILEYSSFNSFTQAISNKPYPYYGAQPTTYGELTVGVSYRPSFINKHVHFGQFTIRPEIRLDKSLNGTRPFNQAGTVENPVVTNGTNNMLWFNCDAIWAF
ncbi:outer membrane beta-barrel protein [Acetobacter sp.]|uniref:outer membrane beta-barrel protein n=1 Tax=Acetobacter sp. TaxID=440 RepID=UPI0039EC0D41